MGIVSFRVLEWVAISFPPLRIKELTQDHGTQSNCGFVAEAD
jgi:hypothetical protein